jgi:hypothetical protein
MYTFCGHTVGGRQKLGTGWALKKAFEWMNYHGPWGKGRGREGKSLAKVCGLLVVHSHGGSLTPNSWKGSHSRSPSRAGWEWGITMLWCGCEGCLFLSDCRPVKGSGSLRKRIRIKVLRARLRPPVLCQEPFLTWFGYSRVNQLVLRWWWCIQLGRSNQWPENPKIFSD